MLFLISIESTTLISNGYAMKSNAVQNIVFAET